MILIDNLNILKSSYPDIWDQIKQFEDEENRTLTQIEETRNGDKTLSITKDDKKVYLHSKYNPIREAETIVESFDDIDEDTNIIFYGTGLGYHIQLILETYKDIKYYIYEPMPELLYGFLSNANLRALRVNRLMGVSADFIDSSMDKFIDRNRDKIKIIELPSHIQIFPEEYELFNGIMIKAIKAKRSYITTTCFFQKKWIINCMKNFKEVLSTPNIILEKKGAFKGKTAILVAAGPSLNDEIENLRYIKDNGLAYIFSVGSAINTLIHHDIYPDALTSYDPKVGNQVVTKTIKSRNIKEIPIIFGSSIGYETLENYPGDKYHMITSQDTVASYFLKDKDGKGISIVQDAPSIAVVTLQLLYTLGFSNILLVGQNLGYRGKQRYAEGISYSKELTDEQLENGIWVKDVYGNEILTNEGFNSMRHRMESYIKLLPDINVANTTKGGANIEGTEFKELIEVMETSLKEKIVDEDWLVSNKTCYDKEHLESRIKRMDRALDNALKINKEYKLILTRIQKMINNRNYTQAEKLYTRLDKELRKIENNDFYKTFILPMNRVQYKILADSIDSLNVIGDPYEKGHKIIECFNTFIDVCISDINIIQEIYKDFNYSIISYKGG